MEIGVIGLGKMGLNLALNLKEHHHKVQGLDISSTAVSQARENDIPAYQEISEFLATFEQKNHLVNASCWRDNRKHVKKTFSKTRTRRHYY